MKNALEMAIPLAKHCELTDKGELFEGYGNQFSFLSGQAIIIPAQHNRSSGHHGKSIILYLDPYFSEALAGVNSFEKRVENLFSIKDKWCSIELKAYLETCLEPD